MLSIITKKTLLYTRQEIWFWKGEEIKRSNNDMFYVSFVKPEFKTNYFKEVTTLFIDLTQDKEALFSDIKPNFRNEIRRAEKEECVCSIKENFSEKELVQIIKDYQKFAQTKGLDEDLSMDRLGAYCRDKVFMTSTVSCKNEFICTHVYLLNNKISASLLLSFDNITFTDDALRGFANKYLHWQDIVYFKEKDFNYYDFGGVDLVDSPAGIAKFKQSFGGSLVHGYNFSRVSGIYGFLAKMRKP